MKLAVIGHPVGHSKSPQIHNEWLRRHNIAGTYTAVDITPEDLTKRVQGLVLERYQGFNVTIPHKQAIMAQCARIEDKARKIGAVNTVVVRDGAMEGFNTDAYGFTENIRQAKPKFEFNGAHALVLGAGGAANAVVYGLLEEGVSRIILTNRTRAKAEALSQMAPDKIKVLEWEERESALAATDLLVNTTALGMQGSAPLEISLDTLKQGALVTDIVYAPLMTGLLSQAQAKGYDIVTGIGMLFYQAQKAFALWTDVLPDVDEALIKKVCG
jgi:shikimate dehydrogenase